MHRYLKTVSLLSLIVFVVSCNGEKTAGPTIQFDSQTWQLVGPTDDHGGLIVADLTAQEYSNGDNSRRLVEFLPVEGSEYTRTLSTQKRNASGAWENDGLQATWYPDGTYEEIPYKNGELHGTQVAWHANGELSFDRQYENGKMHGTEYGWYENGDHKYESVNANGEVMSYTAWDESGNITHSETY